MNNKDIVQELISLQLYIRNTPLSSIKKDFIDDKLHDIICEIDEDVEDYPGIWDNSDGGHNPEMIEEDD